MYKSNAKEFVKAAGTLGALAIQLEIASTSGLSADLRQSLRTRLAQVKFLCQKIHAGETQNQVGSLIHLLASETDVEEARVALTKCTKAFDDELASRQIFLLDERATKVYEFGDLHVFGDSISAFPSALPDVIEATKCYALECWAGATYHLLRIIEISLRKLAGHLELPIDFEASDCTWSRICWALIERWPASGSGPVPPSKRQQDEGYIHDCVETLRYIEGVTLNSDLHFRVFSTAGKASAGHLLRATTDLTLAIASII